MGFYTANYIKRLVKEDHAAITTHLKSKNNDFRSYIDSTLPFSLFLHINKLEREVVTTGNEFIKLASEQTGLPTEFIITQILSAYKEVINGYIDEYPYQHTWQLNDKLKQFAEAVSTNSNILSTLKQNFSKTFYIKEVSKKDTSILLVSPSFKTVQSSFGKKFREKFNYSAFSDMRRTDGGLDLDSPRSVITNLLNKNFSQLQNLGHIEVDVISTSSKEVKRGIVTPKLLSAIVELPNSIAPEKIARQFSRDTGQAQTRVIVRKKFDKNKLAFELLVEAGFLVGTAESRRQNLGKAPLEQAFVLGKGLTDKIRKNPKLLEELETSKSINQYISDSIVGIFRQGKTPIYSSITTITQATKVPIVVPKLDFKVKVPTKTSIRIPNTRRVLSSVSNLLAILQAGINKQVAKNMGQGNEHRVLNYRTGRFAESVQVQRLSESRQGMITAFYSYMRNPYGTFSEGGRQQFPKSRDPKLLISKSVRELAAPIVGARMRAVLV